MKVVYLIYRSLANFKHTLLVSVFGYSSYCCHSPKCSEYTLQRVQKDGTIRGLWKGFSRLITCW